MLRRQEEQIVLPYGGIPRLRTKWITSREGEKTVPRERKKHRRIFERLLANPNFVDRIAAFNLSPLWHAAIERYILTDEIWLPPDRRISQPIVATDHFGRKRLFIEIFADTTKADWIQSLPGRLPGTSRKRKVSPWKTVADLQRYLPGSDKKWDRAEVEGEQEILACFQKGWPSAKVLDHLKSRLRGEMGVIGKHGDDETDEQRCARYRFETACEALKRRVYRIANRRGVTQETH